MTDTITTPTEVQPITDLEKWATNHGATMLTAVGYLRVRLDEEAAPLTYVVNPQRTAVEVRRFDSNGLAVVEQRSISAYALTKPYILGPIMYEIAGKVIARSVRYTDDADNLDLVELSEHERYALPAEWHRPVWYDIATPAAWMCQVCWGESIAYQWPCDVASRHGRDIAKSLKLPYTR